MPSSCLEMKPLPSRSKTLKASRISGEGQSWSGPHHCPHSPLPRPLASQTPPPEPGMETAPTALTLTTLWRPCRSGQRQSVCGPRVHYSAASLELGAGQAHSSGAGARQR